MKSRNILFLAASIAAAGLLHGCAAPRPLIEARSEVQAAERDGVTSKYAPVALAEARDQLNAAETAYNTRKDGATVAHESALAKTKAGIAKEQAKTAKAQADIARAEAERQSLLVDRLERLANNASAASEKAAADLARAERARAEAEAARQRAEDERRRAEDLAGRLAQEQDGRLSLERQRAEAERQRAADLERQLAAAEAARREAENARSSASRDAERARLEAERAARNASNSDRSAEEARRLAALNAKQTPRGQLINIPDVLFEFDRYNLTQRGVGTVQQIVNFLKDYPDNYVLVEGHTDSVGSHGYNQKLSERRADAITSALLRSGINTSRLVSLGYSEDYPVTSNDTESGRAQNRRVEIYISDDDKPVRPRR